MKLLIQAINLFQEGIDADLILEYLVEEDSDKAATAAATKMAAKIKDPEKKKKAIAKFKTHMLKRMKNEDYNGISGDNYYSSNSFDDIELMPVSNDIDMDIDNDFDEPLDFSEPDLPDAMPDAVTDLDTDDSYDSIDLDDLGIDDLDLIS